MNNQKLTKTELFYPGYLANKSVPFYIPFDGQLTVVAMGLVDSDYIEFEIIHVPATDSCNMLMPEVSVTGYQPLRYNGKNVRLTADNPVAILNNPQGFMIRAVRHVAEEVTYTGVYVWASPTRTPMNEDLNGFKYTNMDIITDDFTESEEGDV